MGSFSLRLLVSFFFSASVPAWAVAPQSGSEFASELTSIYREQGTDVLVRHLREHAESGLDLSGLRTQVLDANSGHPEEITVKMHPKMAASVAFANEQLKAVGIDFFVFKADFDPSEPDPTVPFKNDAAAYKKWRLARIATVPVIGFAASLVEAGLLSHGASHGASIFPTLARATAILALELQFSAFSNWWNLNFWSDERPLIGARIPEFTSAQQSRLIARLNGVVGIANQALAGLKRSFAYNYATNYIYTGIVYTSGLVAALAVGDHSYDFNFIKIVSDSFLVTTAFFGAFGMNQIFLAKYLSRGAITEFQRYRRETVALWWNALGRAVSLIPGLKSLGLGMQLSFGGFVTLPLTIKGVGLKAYNERTRDILEANARVEPAPPQKLCQRLLSGLNFRLR